MLVKNVLASAAAVVGIGASATLAQAPAGAPPAAPRICVIDVAYIFENHPTFKQKISAVDAQIKAAEDEINKSRENILAEVKGLQTYKQDSPEFKQKEEMIATRESQLKLDFMRKEKDFLERKSAIAFETYDELRKLIRGFCEANNVSMVIRCSREEMDPKKPMTVSQGINKDVVYFHPNNDLTDSVLNYLKQSVPAGTPTSAGPAAQQPVNTATRPGVQPRR